MTDGWCGSSDIQTDSLVLVTVLSYEPCGPLAAGMRRTTIRSDAIIPVGKSSVKSRRLRSTAIGTIAMTRRLFGSTPAALAIPRRPIRRAPNQMRRLKRLVNRGKAKKVFQTWLAPDGCALEGCMFRIATYVRTLSSSIHCRAKNRTLSDGAALRRMRPRDCEAAGQGSIKHVRKPHQCRLRIRLCHDARRPAWTKPDATIGANRPVGLVGAVRQVYPRRPR
jgi:hypothetical protein